MTEKEVLGFEPTTRLEQVGMSDGIFGKDTILGQVGRSKLS
jgi:hypothetical protein